MITNETVQWKGNNQVTISSLPGHPVSVGSEEWEYWLEVTHAFYYRNYDGRSMTVTRKGRGKYWYAHKTIQNQKRTLYIGKVITLEKLQRSCTQVNMYGWDMRKRWKV